MAPHRPLQCAMCASQCCHNPQLRLRRQPSCWQGHWHPWPQPQLHRCVGRRTKCHRHRLATCCGCDVLCCRVLCLLPLPPLLLQICEVSAAAAAPCHLAVDRDTRPLLTPDQLAAACLLLLQAAATPPGYRHSGCCLTAAPVWVTLLLRRICPALPAGLRRPPRECRLWSNQCFSARLP